MRSGCLLLIIVVAATMGVAIAQSLPVGPAGLPVRASPEQVLRMSEALRQRANRFKHSPHFNKDSVLVCYQRALNLLEKARPLPEGPLIALCTELSQYCFRVNEDASAKRYIDRAWAIADRQRQQGVRNPALFYPIRAFQARLAVEQGDLNRAMTLMLDAASLATGDSPRLKAQLLKDQGSFYARYNTGIYRRVGMGIPLLHQSLRLYQSFNDDRDARAVADMYHELVWYHNVKGQTDSCDYYYDRLYGLLPVLNDPIETNWYYATRGNNLSRREQYARARRLIQKSLDLIKTYHLEWSQVYPFDLNLMGVVSFKEGRYAEAEQYLLQARNAGRRIQFAQADMTYLEHRAELYEHKGDYKQALGFFHQYTDKKEAWIEARSGESIRQTELRVNLLEKEAQIARQQTERQTFMTGLVAAGLLTLLLAVVGVGLYRRNRTRQRTNQQLATLNADLAKRNAENELLLKEIHHRVKNNLEVVSSLLELQSAQIDDPDVQAAMLASQNRVQSMGILHQKLYQSEHLAFIEMRQYFQNLSENILDSYNATDRVTVDCPMAELDLDVDTAVPVGLIVNELLTNALKYAFPPGQPGRVRLGLDDLGAGRLRLLVADNGIGKVATDQPKGTGFGTQLVELLTRQLDGVLRQESTTGTRISIEFSRMKVAG